MNTSLQLSKLLRKAKTIPFGDRTKIVLMSDVHRGEGGAADDFSKTQNLYYAALQNYDRKGFIYIELGDGDELWKNSRFADIIDTYANVFRVLSKLYREGRFYTLYGNHDMLKRDKAWMRNNMSEYYVQHLKKTKQLFPGMEAQESIVLRHTSGYEILLAHGHQADFLNSSLWKLSRFLVRYLWKPLESIGIKDPMSTSKNHKKRTALEEKYMRWCKENKRMMIAGHTHRSVFPNPEDPLYFNDGCCIHPRSITAIEIESGHIALIKWSVQTREDKVLFVSRDVLKGPLPLKDYFDRMLI